MNKAFLLLCFIAIFAFSAVAQDKIESEQRRSFRAIREGPSDSSDDEVENFSDLSDSEDAGENDDDDYFAEGELVNLEAGSDMDNDGSNCVEEIICTSVSIPRGAAAKQVCKTQITCK